MKSFKIVMMVMAIVTGNYIFSTENLAGDAATKAVTENLVFNTTGYIIVAVLENKLGHDFYQFTTIQPLLDSNKKPVGTMAQVDATALPNSINFRKGITSKVVGYVVKNAEGAKKFTNDVMHSKKHTKLPSQCGIASGSMNCPALTDLNDYQITVVTDPKGNKSLTWVRLDSIKMIPTGKGSSQNGFKNQSDSIEKKDDSAAAKK